MKLKYSKEDGKRIYYAEDRKYKIVPNDQGFSAFELIDGKYAFSFFQTTLHEVKYGLMRKIHE